MTGSADELACPACEGPLLGNFDAVASLKNDTLQIEFDCLSCGTPLALAPNPDAPADDETVVEERDDDSP